MTEPKQDAPLSEKRTKQYGRDYAKHIYGYTTHGGLRGMFYNARATYQENIQYALGKNPIDKFKKWMKVEDPKSPSPIVLDWRIRNFASNLFNVAVNMLAQENYKPECTAIDPYSHKKRKELKNRYEDYLRNPTWYDEQKEILGDSIVPDGAEEMKNITDKNELSRRMGEKLRMGMNAEKAIELFMKANRYDEIKLQNAEDLIANGVMAQAQEMDRFGRIVYKYLNPANLIVPYSNYWDFRDIDKFGYLHQGITLTQMKEMFGGDALSEDEWNDIEANHTSPVTTNYNDPQNLRDYNYNQKNVNLMEFWFRTYVEDIYEVKKVKDNPFVYPAKKGRGNSDQYSEAKNKYGKKYRTNGKYDVYKDGYMVWFRGYWVVNSEYILGYDMKENMEREGECFEKAPAPIKIKAPGMRDGLVTSKMEQSKPFLDDIQRCWLKIQHLIAEARPKGAYIDLDFLEAANMAGAGGTILTKKQLLDLYYQKGVVVGRSKDPSGQYMNRPPITEMENGISDDLPKIHSQMMSSIQQLKEILGINDIVAAGLPNPKTGKKVAEMSVQATSNAMFHLFNAQRVMYLDACKTTLNLYRFAVQNGKAKELFVDAFGIDQVEYDAMTKHSDLLKYSVSIDIMPGNEQWDQFYAEVTQTIGTTISMSQWLYLKRIDNLKEAEQAFKQFEKEYAIQQREIEKERVDYNAQVQQKSNEQALANKQAEIEAEIALIRAKGEEERLTQREKFQYDMQLKQLEMTLSTEKDISKIIATEGLKEESPV